ncbi:4a-hydroxytetrahydrobiopterin dehydratase [Rhodococcus rhodnii]|uniref:Putative pterin-4-alpha-carbinolamine dehydratase n=1 Tax=Rhodococcus rhodnii TaxID=38312 RepID=A0A6P2CJ54_9NOCA|nr:4a-hydroxytetrahydrobiopterin dehydratase [Rhodococcus rhodnii]TXG91791.1 4a-hydroxytetrahydrobiopterin dehydratase [Rhodococcus rhodnii]
MPSLLSDGEITAALAGLPRWRRAGDALARTDEAPSFPDAIDRVRRVADIAERRDHHPDIDIRWRTVTYTLRTHSAGGITELDVELARSIEPELGRE